MWLARNFFFQAEDGIRDRDVTGVQTCALPISKQLKRGINNLKQKYHGGVDSSPVAVSRRRTRTSPINASGVRSEERRVGKECMAERPAELSERDIQDHCLRDVHYRCVSACCQR